MPTTVSITRRVALLAGALALAGCTSLVGKPTGTDIHVMTSGGFTAAYNALRPDFEKRTGHTVQTAYGASMGNATDAIPVRLARGEPADVESLPARRSMRSSRTARSSPAARSIW